MLAALLPPPPLPLPKSAPVVAFPPKSAFASRISRKSSLDRTRCNGGAPVPFTVVVVVVKDSKEFVDEDAAAAGPPPLLPRLRCRGAGADDVGGGPGIFDDDEDDEA